MPVSIHHIVVDAHDLPGLAGFWSEVLGWPILSAKPREVVVGPAVDAPFGLCFMPAGETRKTGKNRLHFDLNADPDVPGDREAEIERILALGARRVDVGQTGDESWLVLADPEGNEFCVVRPKRDLIG
ncbi:VOC family protein [Yinghuangia seranimata]|uniref:VOC family protein n=1 Tax=Yinghuangia seranimata TaxID=408067 RepID=UPI00248B3206|nr:VOC family protein [Yinghuangia seranimata]MDI2131112.1 VOC family protein [Yinghuangia seranimata]